MKTIYPNYELNKKKSNSPKRKKTIKLQTKLWLYFSILSELILVSFAIIFYLYISPILIENKIDSVKSINYTFNEQIDSAVKELDDISANISYTNLIMGDFKEYFESNNSNDEFKNLLNLFMALNGTDSKAEQINLYDLNGNVIRTGIRNNKTTVELTSLDWYANTLALKGLKYISLPYETSSYSSSTNMTKWYLSVYRILNNSKGQQVGFTETTKKCSSIFKSIINYENQENRLLKTYIFDQNGTLLYPYIIENSTEYNSELYSEYYNAVNVNIEYDKTSLISHMNFNTNQEEYIVYTVSSYTKWIYVSVEAKKEILAPAIHSLGFLLPLTILCFSVSMILSYLLSKNTIKPINYLKQMIHDLKLDTLGTKQRPEYKTYYELENIYEDFEKMSEQLNISMVELIELRESELGAKNLALQSQINPHFYYNTLASIIILSENKQNTHVIQLCKNLSEIMRYITDNSTTIVTLKDEIDYIEKYLYCMKVRYLDSLHIKIDIPKELENIRLPKFIIQPLVENAIKYGIDTLPPWIIKIQGEISDDGWAIHIIDTGNGFSEKVLNDLSQKFHTLPEHSDLHNLHVNGMGLQNVHLRWKIFAKEKYLFKLKNTKDHHGEVIIGMKEGDVTT